jgi:hypothetical protein
MNPIQIQHQEGHLPGTHGALNETVRNGIFQKAAVEEAGKIVGDGPLAGGFSPPYNILQIPGGLIEPPGLNRPNGLEQFAPYHGMFKNNMVEGLSAERHKAGIFLRDKGGRPGRVGDKGHFAEEFSGLNVKDPVLGSLCPGHKGSDRSKEEDEYFLSLIPFLKNNITLFDPAALQKCREDPEFRFA